MSKILAVSTLGFPRIGAKRELKAALENFWSGTTDEQALLMDASRMRATNWAIQRRLGITHIPSNDFSLYDHVLDTSVMVGAIPPIYGWRGAGVPLDTYFAMARGTHGHRENDLPALEMTKWFDTNYHYLVPEFYLGQSFVLASTKPIDQFREAKALGFDTRPVLLGPVTYLLLGKAKNGVFDTLSLLPGLLPVYAELLKRLQREGADWVQIDEPCLVLDTSDDVRRALKTAYASLAEAAPGLKLLLTTYFGALDDNLHTVLGLPISGLHLDLIRAPEQLSEIAAKAPSDLALSLGVIDGRNVWRANLPTILERIEPLASKRGLDKLMLGPSCSLLHVPIDLNLETELDPELKSWLAFAVQKVEELVTLTQALDQGRDSVRDGLAAASAAAQARRGSTRIHNAVVKARLASVTPNMAQRSSDFSIRKKAQHDNLALPLYPTTTIGSFPQTADVRKARAAHGRGNLGNRDYEKFLRDHIETAVRWQEDLDIDVLVHGEFERNDMVQYFGEQLTGYAFTKHGWVQSYGSRYVRPPIIFGDVSRPEAMTVRWTVFAQSLTKRIMKGMLTGPITMLQWSFVRDDLSRDDVCRQIALALRDEVTDLEQAGIRVIQIDEPAMREGLPLRRHNWKTYLDWAVECFRLTGACVADRTQIHTHMCYSEFNDIIAAIGALDADVISIETARSKMELLDAFTAYRYPNEIGPGVYDIHAPRIPSAEEMAALILKARERLAPEQIWVNPDCGLKTRKWEEVEPALRNMVAAAKQIRQAESLRAQ
jgi:5-methyltetrahydropteroyltriglutamate--homocysteine methyltransferase